MKAIQPYLNFDGNAREAMTFYHGIIGGELAIQTVADMKGAGAEPGDENRTIHSSISKGAPLLMASDTMPGMTVNFGNNAHICVECDSGEELERFFAGLSAGGVVTMPVQDTFWGAKFGMLIDKYGMQWMFNHTKTPA